MSLIKAGMTAASETKVEQPIRSLAFVINTTANNFAAARAAMAATTISIEKQTAKGTEPILYLENFIDILEFAAAETGAIQSDAAAGATVIRASYELADDGDLVFNDSRDLKVTFAGIPAGYTVDVYGLESAIFSLTNLHNCIERVKVDSGTPKMIPTVNSKLIAVPVATTTKLELYYPTGKTVTMVPEELKNYAYETNKEVLNEDGVVTCGFANFVMINVTDCAQVRITTSADVTIKKITYKNI